MKLELNNTQTVGSKENCYHCGNVLENDKIHALIANKEAYYCCEGCKTVSGLIHENGNDFYYEIKGNLKTKPVELSEKNENEDLDSDFILKKYTHSSVDGKLKVFIKIANIHCSACIWLNEKVLQNLEGVYRAEINFASGRASVEFDPGKVKLSQIFETIRAIGYKPVLFAPNEKEQNQNNNLNSLFTRLGVAGFCFGNIMLFSVALYSGYFAGIDMEFKRLLHYVSWALATPAYLYSGYPFMRGAFSALRTRTLTMDFLLFTGISLAYFYSIFVTLTDRGEVYFDSVCMIYFFILIGKFFEEKARVKASEEIENILCKLPEMVTQVQPDGTENTIPSEQVQKGMMIKAIPGSRIPVDGLLVSESARLDESVISGESRPVSKKLGNFLLAGSIVLESPLTFVSSNSWIESSLANMKNKLESALLSKPKIQILTEKIASYFIRTVFILAIGTFIYWYGNSGNFETALIYMISVLIVACPCALGISVPTALVMNHIINSKGGILVRNPNVIEPLSKLDTILFDKTGTLTEGKFKILEHKVENPEIYNFAYLAEMDSKHPIAISLKNELKNLGFINKSELGSYSIIQTKMFPGQGIRAEIEKEGNRYFVLIGSKEFVRIETETEFESLDKKGAEVCISINGKNMGQFILGDKLKSGSKELIEYLQSNGKSIQILSGDNEHSVHKIAKELKIDSYKSNCKPDDKMAITKALQKEKKIVALVGDGINDALSLATADVGISHSEAEHISIDKSDVVIVDESLYTIAQLISNAKLTNRVIKQNILLSLMYNSIMLPLAMSGLMLPVLCAGFMTLSSLTVLINSISIRWRKEKLC